MKLYIPAIGDRLTLTKSWTFDVYMERRNDKFLKTMGLIPKDFNRWSDRFDAAHQFKKVECTLPKGTTLEVDRVYIRTFNKSALKEDNDFDSITFKVVENGKGKMNKRFWTKLTCANQVEFSQEIDSCYRDRVKAVRAVMEA